MYRLREHEFEFEFEMYWRRASCVVWNLFSSTEQFLHRVREREYVIKSECSLQIYCRLHSDLMTYSLSLTRCKNCSVLENKFQTTHDARRQYISNSNSNSCSLSRY